MGSLGGSSSGLNLPGLGKNEPKVGTVLSYLNGKPYKVFAGPWGTQSFETYQKLHYRDPKSFPKLSGTLPTSVTEPEVKKPAGAAAPVTAEDWESPRPEPGAATDVTAGDVGEQMGKTPADPVLEELLGVAKGSLSPEFLKGRTDEAIRQFVVTSTVAEALGAEKAEQRRRREVELEKIRQWADLTKTATTANLMSQALLGQALIASQQPSAAMADVLGKGAETAQRVLGPLTLRS